MSELAVNSCAFEAALDNPAESITAQISAASLPSSDCLVSGNGIFFEKITAAIATGATVTLLSPPPTATSPTGTLLAPDTIDITGTAENVLENGKKAVQKDDKGSKSVTFTFPGQQGSQVQYAVNVTVKVKDAGQSDVVAS